MKLFKETHNEEADLAVIQYGGGTICIVEPIDITEEEILQAELTLMEGECQAKINGFLEGINWALSKLNGDGK